MVAEGQNTRGQVKKDATQKLLTKWLGNHEDGYPTIYLIKLLDDNGLDLI